MTTDATTMTRSDLAQKIVDAVDCTAKVWEKEGKVRVYLSHRGKDYGFVSITNSGIEFSLTGYANNAYGRVIREATEGIEIKQESFREQMLASCSGTKQESWNAYHRQNPSEEYHFGAADEESF